MPWSCFVRLFKHGESRERKPEIKVADVEGSNVWEKCRVSDHGSDISSTRGPKDSASSFDSGWTSKHSKQAKMATASYPSKRPAASTISSDQEEEVANLEYLTDVDDAAKKAATLLASIRLNLDPYSLGPSRPAKGGNWRWRRRLSRVDIHGVEIGTKEAAALATLLSPQRNTDGSLSFPEHLETLTIHGVWLGPEAASEIAAIIKPCMPVSGKFEVTTNVCNTKIKELDLQGNYIGDVGVVAIANAMDGPHGLKTLWLPSNGITSEGVAALVPRIWSSSGGPGVEVLGLGSNKLGDEGLEIICGAMEPRQSSSHKADGTWEFPAGPKRINLWGNGITDTGACSLSVALNPRTNSDGTTAVNQTLESIALFRNGLTDEGKQRLAEVAAAVTAARGPGGTPLHITC